MSSKVLLRVASILMLIHCILHTIGFSGWKSDPNRQVVIKMMTGPKVPFMGANRNMGEFYDGFGYATTIALLLIAVSLWIISGELGSSLAKKLTLTFAVILALWGADEIIYFFPFAASISWLSAVCCFWAFFKLPKQT